MTKLIIENGIFAIHDFDQFGREGEFHDLFLQIPFETTRLVFFNCKFNSIGIREIQSALTLIPPSVENVLIRNCGFGHLVLLISSFPSTVKAIHFSDSHYGRLLNHCLVEMVQAIPKHISLLNLMNIDLGRNHSIEYLISVFQAIPSSVQRVFLNGINLQNLSPADQISLIKAIPSHIKAIDVDWMIFSDVTLEQFLSLKNYFNWIETIYCEGVTARLTNDKYSKAIMSMFPFCKKIVLSNPYVDKFSHDPSNNDLRQCWRNYTVDKGSLYYTLFVELQRRGGCMRSDGSYYIPDLNEDIPHEPS